MLVAFGIAAPSMWGWCAAQLYEFIKYIDFGIHKYLDVDNKLEINGHNLTMKC